MLDKMGSGIAHADMRPNGVHLYPKQKWEEHRQNKETRVPKSIPRVKGIHHDWLESIKNGTKSCSDFSYSGPLTEVIILGTLARFPELINIPLKANAHPALASNY